MKNPKETLLKRLEEIRNTVLEELSDTQVLEILAERKQITAQLEKIKKVEAGRQHLKQEHDEVEEEISALNKEISPEKDDEELMTLIEKRKGLEDELVRIERALEAPLVKEDSLAEMPASPDIPAKETSLLKVAQASETGEEPGTVELSALADSTPASLISETVSTPPQDESKESVTTSEPVSVAEAAPAPKKPLFKEEAFGSEGIRTEENLTDEKFARFLPQLEANRENLSNFLQDLPREVRQHKGFMLKVAEIDPAYAMHYALDNLKRDPDFNVRVARLRPVRNSGNPLAEMLPEMRTGAVVLAALRQDFRNVRFALPTMPEYDEILASAKKAALEKVKSLKEAADVTFLIPKILQKDKGFMEEVQKSIH